DPPATISATPRAAAPASGFAARLAECETSTAVAERLAEHLSTIVPRSAVRVHLLGPGDRCGVCLHARQCEQRDRCLHLEASVGTFVQPPGLAERVPRATAGWAEALAATEPFAIGEFPPEAVGPVASGDEGVWIPL